MAGCLARGLDKVNQERECDYGTHRCDSTSVEDATLAEAVMHLERLLRGDPIWWAAQLSICTIVSLTMKNNCRSLTYFVSCT